MTRVPLGGRTSKLSDLEVETTRLLEGFLTRNTEFLPSMCEKSANKRVAEKFHLNSFAHNHPLLSEKSKVSTK